MVRFCVVEGCDHTDGNSLAHRFPKNVEHRTRWQSALNLQSYDLDSLLHKYVVCTNHFKKSDYRNAISTSLNSTAVPNLQEIKEKDNQEIIPVVSPNRNEAYITTESVKATSSSNLTKMIQSKPVNKPLILTKVKDLNIENKYHTDKRKRRTSTQMEKELNTLQKMANNTNPALNHLPTFYPENNEMEIIVSTDSMYDREGPTIVEIVVQDAETQTDTRLEEEQNIINEKHPEFGSFSRLQLIQLLEEREQKINTLEKKVEKFESAMQAFKMLMNPSDV